MAEYIVARATLHGQPFRTKKSLREALLDPATRPLVRFTGLGLSRAFNGGLDDLKPSQALSIAGPEPEYDRRWFTTIQVQDGKVRFT